MFKSHRELLLAVLNGEKITHKTWLNHKWVRLDPEEEKFVNNHGGEEFISLGAYDVWLLWQEPKIKVSQMELESIFRNMLEEVEHSRIHIPSFSKKEAERIFEAYL